MAQHQIAWRQKHIADKRRGTQNGQTRPWILPPELWEEGLWPGIRSGSVCSLPEYLITPGKKVEKHKGVHNLKSSWVLCANLYFPFRQAVVSLPNTRPALIQKGLRFLLRLGCPFPKAHPVQCSNDFR